MKDISPHLKILSLSKNKNLMKISEYRALNKKNKYGAVKTAYKGETYDSKAEAYVAQLLDIRRRDKKERVIAVERQKKYKIMVNGLYCGYYRADFYVTFLMGKHRINRVVEVKSPATEKLPAWRFKKKVVEASSGIVIETYIVDYQKGKPHLKEIK